MHFFQNLKKLVNFKMTTANQSAFLKLTNFSKQNQKVNINQLISLGNENSYLIKVSSSKTNNKWKWKFIYKLNIIKPESSCLFINMNEKDMSPNQSQIKDINVSRPKIMRINVVYIELTKRRNLQNLHNYHINYH